MDDSTMTLFHFLVGLINAYYFVRLLLLPLDIYAIVIIYKLHKALYGKGILWQLIGFYREFMVGRIGFGKVTSVLMPISWFAGFLMVYIANGTIEIMDVEGLIILLIFVTTICIIAHLMYGVAVVSTAKEYGRIKADKKYRKKMADELQWMFKWIKWWSFRDLEAITDTSAAEANSKNKNDDAEDDYDDGL